jgi:hypothetical protein
MPSEFQVADQGLGAAVAEAEGLGAELADVEAGGRPAGDGAAFQLAVIPGGSQFPAPSSL